MDPRSALLSDNIRIRVFFDFWTLTQMDFSPNSSNSKKCRCSYNCNTCMELIGLWKCVVLWLMLWCLLRVVGETSQSQLRGRWRGFGFGQSAPPPGLDSSLAFPSGRPPPGRPRAGISPVHPQWTFWEKQNSIHLPLHSSLYEVGYFLTFRIFPQKSWPKYLKPFSTKISENKFCQKIKQYHWKISSFCRRNQRNFNLKMKSCRYFAKSTHALWVTDTKPVPKF